MTRRKVDFGRFLDRLDQVTMPRPEGRIEKVLGIAIEAVGLSASLGELCWIQPHHGKIVSALVVGFRRNITLLMPVDELDGLTPGCRIVASGKPLTIGVSAQMLGRVIDPLGRALDGGPPIIADTFVPLQRGPVNAMERPPIDSWLPTGVRAVDGLLSLAKGQRIGIFAGSGVGKSTLLGMVSRNALSDVNVIALIGERGREVQHFITHALGQEGLSRSVVVVATSDSSPLRRFLGAHTATAIAEYFRDQRSDVLFVMDSVTRLAGAQREIGLSLGEPPTAKGYPPSVYGLLPRLVERLGTSAKGSITGLYTVLVDGDDMNDPIGDTMRSLLDGHIVLSRDLANRAHFPPIEILTSVSRVMSDVVSDEHQRAASRFRELYATYEQNRDLIEVGAYRTGNNPTLDEAIEQLGSMNAFLRQLDTETTSKEDLIARLKSATGDNRPEPLGARAISRSATQG